MDRRVKLLLGVIAAFGLSACADLGAIGEPEGGWPCTRYNDESVDQFNLNLYPGSLTLKVGQTAQISLETTYLDLDNDRVAVQCQPSWFLYDNAASVSFDSSTLTVRGVTPGSVRVFARVTGARTAEDYVAVTVVK